MKVSAFPLPLRVEFLDGRQWKPIDLFEYHSRKYGRRSLDIGQIYDFGSIPPALQNFISPTRGLGKSFLIHDDAYTRGDLTRDEADDLLWEAMARETKELNAWRRHCIAVKAGFIPDKGVGIIRRWLIYRAVRRAGFVAWYQHRAEDAARQRSEKSARG